MLVKLKGVAKEQGVFIVTLPGFNLFQLATHVA